MQVRLSSISVYYFETNICNGDFPPQPKSMLNVHNKNTRVMVCMQSKLTLKTNSANADNNAQPPYGPNQTSMMKLFGENTLLSTILAKSSITDVMRVLSTPLQSV